MAANFIIEELSSSLVREYLNRKGLKETLTVLDKELPRTERSFNKRNALARSLCIESLVVKKNKSDPLARPSLSILESLVQYIVDNPIDKQSSYTPLEQSNRTPKEQLSHTPNQSEMVSHSTLKNGNPVTYNEPRPSSTIPITKSNHRISSTGLLPHAKSRGRVKIRGATKGLTDKQTPSNEQTPITTTAPSGITRSHNQSSHDVMSHDSSKEFIGTNQQEALSEFVFEDIENSTYFDTTSTLIQGNRTRTVAPSSIGKAISLDTAKSLRELVFGTATGPSFNNEWHIQGLTFNQSDSQLSYGIVQHKGGPCGLLACVQAYILKHVLFNDDIASQSNEIPLLSVQQQRDALINAICSILWRVRDNEVVVTLKSSSTSINKTHQNRHYSPDGLTEQLVVYKFTQVEQLKEFVSNHINNFMSGGINDEAHSDGAILLLYSIVLSHSIARTKGEMDSGSNTLIGSHGYCSQEVINLILTGVASSNVFNGESVIKGENAPPTILRGVCSPCDIGFLTLFEHYGACEVGTHYKNPSLPIWVICSESHYTVLFGLSKDVLRKTGSRCFLLHYYDGLAHLNEPIILEIICDNSEGSSKGFASEGSSKDLIPPLEEIIKLKWINCTKVHWNCEALL